MGIVAWCGAKATRLVQTREDEVEDIVAGQGFGASQQMQGSHTPVQAVQSKVLGEPVLQLVFALLRSDPCECKTRCAPGRRTVSRLWIYLTCLSTWRRASAGREAMPLPGPETRDMVLACSGLRFVHCDDVCGGRGWRAGGSQGLKRSS